MRSVAAPAMSRSSPAGSCTGLFAAEAADLFARQIEHVVALHELLVTGTLRVSAKGGAESCS